jgi:arylsulfatase A-like enzyme
MNVLVVMNDTLRRDHVGAYGLPPPWSRPGRPPGGQDGAPDGEPFIQTPSLDRLAREAALFERFYVSSYPTIPCRTDLFTGRYSFPHRPWQPLEPGDVVLSELARRAGYLPVLFFDTPPLGNDDGNFTRGFAGWQWVRGQHADRWNVDPFDPPLPAAPYKLKGTPQTRLYLRNTHDRVYERDWMCARTLSAAMDWLERNHTRGRPGGPPGFVMYVDMWDPHEPFDAPPFDVARYADPRYTGERVIYPQYGRPDYLSPEEHDHVRALYAALVTLADRWLGHLLDKLAVTGLDRHTLVLHLTDHGHLFGDHQLQGKPGGPLGRLYEPTVHIPLLVRHPQGVGAGTRVPGLAQHVDILPTVLDFLGAPIPEGVEGHSLWPLIRGEQARVRDTAYSGRFPNELAAALGLSRNRAQQAAAFDGAAGIATSPGASGAPSPSGSAPNTSRLVEPLTVTTEEWALVSAPRGRPSELYHLEDDPQQTRNVLPEHPDVARELHGRLLRFLETAGGSGATAARIAPFQGDVTRSGAEPEPPALGEDTILFCAEDARGVTLCFDSEAQARSLFRAADGSVPEFRQERAGDLRQRRPQALVYSPTQYAWLSDLV